MHSTVPDPNNPRLTASEWRATSGLAMIFMFRTLGLFMLLPIFVLQAQKYPGGDNAAWVGLAFGAYGLTQMLLQIPYGLASDRWGRKRIIALGLFVFIFGSIWAALATDVYSLFIGRALQGAGAVSAAISALLSDETRDIVRTKSMAIVGASIGLSFALSLVFAPILAGWVGLSGIFWGMAILGLLGLVVLVFWIPVEQKHIPNPHPWLDLRAVVAQPRLLRLNFGVWALHTVQVAMWMVVPWLLLKGGLAQPVHWHIYLPTVLLSFVIMGAGLFRLERAGLLRQAFLFSIVLIASAQLLLLFSLNQVSLLVLGVALFLFFLGFNVLEASQPSLVSRYALAQQRGAALGVYNTTQALGLFTGASLGGLLLESVGNMALLWVNIALLVLWLAIAWGMPPILAKTTHASTDTKLNPSTHPNGGF